MPRSRPQAVQSRAVVLAALGASALLSACASSRVTQTGGLTSYEGLEAAKSARTKARFVADPGGLAAAKTVKIAPVTFAAGVSGEFRAEEGALVANVVGRVLCARLSDRYDVVPPTAGADLTVRAVITRMTPTNRAAAGVSVPLRAASMAFGVPAPGRIPLGMGSFSAEGEALGPSGERLAAMTWARGADMFTNRPRVSRIGDAYELSGAFSGDLAALIVTGKNPLHDIPKDLFARRHRPVPAACDVYGKANGAETFLSGFIGAPPEWTDGRPPR